MGDGVGGGAEGLSARVCAVLEAAGLEKRPKKIRWTKG